MKPGRYDCQYGHVVITKVRTRNDRGQFTPYFWWDVSAWPIDGEGWGETADGQEYAGQVARGMIRELGGLK